MNDIERNKILARFLGYEYFGYDGKSPGYAFTNDYLGWRLKDLKNTPLKLVPKDWFICRKHHELPFDKDWNWIMKVIDKLEKDSYLIEISTENLVIKKSYDFYAPNKLIAFHTFKDNKLQLTFETLSELIQINYNIQP